MEKKITITVDVDGNAVSRTYKIRSADEMPTVEGWGLKIDDMLDTLVGSKEVKEF